MSLFEAHTATIKSNKGGIDPITKEFSNSYNLIADNVKCRVTGTHADNIKLFINRKNYEKIPGGIKMDYKVTITGLSQSYKITRVPMGAGGTNHHWEFFIEESN